MQTPGPGERWNLVPEYTGLVPARTELPSASVIANVSDILNLSGADIDHILRSYDGSR